MRMWMIDPKCLCRKHLLGEHGEIHKHRHVFVKGWSIKCRLGVYPQIEPESMQDRHDALASEMLRRGYNHNSCYNQPNLNNYTKEERTAKVNVSFSIQDLKNRCQDCLKILIESGY